MFTRSGLKHGFRSLIRVNATKDLELVMLGNGGEATSKVMNAVRLVVQEAYDEEPGASRPSS